jgi:hypothetical protein
LSTGKWLPFYEKKRPPNGMRLLWACGTLPATPSGGELLQSIPNGQKNKFTGPQLSGCFMTPDKLLFALVELFDRLKVRYAIVGSVASMSYGEPRFTNDVDIVAELELAHIEPLLATFPGPEFYCSREAVKSAITKRFQFNIIHNTEGVKADIILPGTSELDELQLTRRVWLAVGNQSAWVASPEDVIVKKLEFYRLGGSDKHLRDIASMLRIGGNNLDITYIEHWAEKLHVLDTWRLIESKRNDRN